MVLPPDDLLHRVAEFCLLLRHSLPMLVRMAHDSPLTCPTNPNFKAGKHLLEDLRVYRDCEMPQHQGHLLLPLGTKHLERLYHLSMASEEPDQRPSIEAATIYTDHDVFARCHVRLLFLSASKLDSNLRAVCASLGSYGCISLIYTSSLLMPSVGFLPVVFFGNGH